MVPLFHTRHYTIRFHLIESWEWQSFSQVYFRRSVYIFLQVDLRTFVKSLCHAYNARTGINLMALIDSKNTTLYIIKRDMLSILNLKLFTFSPLRA